MGHDRETASSFCWFEKIQARADHSIRTTMFEECPTMARPLCLEYLGAVYHVTSRGNARRDIVVDDWDRALFLEKLAHVIDRFGWHCHAYCLMDNHYHLCSETPRPTLSRRMRQLNGTYTQAVNRRHQRMGHLLQGRFTRRFW